MGDRIPLAPPSMRVVKVGSTRYKCREFTEPVTILPGQLKVGKLVSIPGASRYLNQWFQQCAGENLVVFQWTPLAATFHFSSFKLLEWLYLEDHSGLGHLEDFEEPERQMGWRLVDWRQHQRHQIFRSNHLGDVPERVGCISQCLEALMTSIENLGVHDRAVFNEARDMLGEYVTYVENGQAYSRESPPFRFTYETYHVS